MIRDIHILGDEGDDDADIVRAPSDLSARELRSSRRNLRAHLNSILADSRVVDMVKTGLL